MKSIYSFSNSGLSKKSDSQVKGVASNILFIKYLICIKGLNALSKLGNTGLPLAPNIYWWFQSTKGYFTVVALLYPDVLAFK